MFGAVYGDVIGSYYEVHSTKKYDFTLNPQSTFTDDTVLTAAVCRAILNHGDDITKSRRKDRALEYAALYKQYYSHYPYAGFGGMFQRWARGDSFESIPSYGNGGAMRAVPIGYSYSTMEQTMLQAEASCMITHRNAEAIKGAKAVCAAVYLARNGESKSAIRGYIEKYFGYRLQEKLSDIRKDYMFEVRASKSVPQAILSFLESEDYESAVRNAVSLGGDADTMACIAGGIAQAYYQTIPDHIRKFCDMRIDSSLRLTVREFEKKYAHFIQ